MRVQDKPDKPLETPPARTPASLGFLLALSALAAYLCWLMAQPFLPALTWAVAIAVVARPLHTVLEKRLRHRNLAAFLAVVVVTAVLIVPGAFLIDHAIREAADALRTLQTSLGSQDWRASLEQQPYIGRLISWVEANFDLTDSIQGLAAAISSRASKVLIASVQTLILLLVMLFTLFYFFRDRRSIVSRFIHLLPLPNDDIKLLLSCTSDAIHATIYGRFTVAAVQGFLSGLMFWILGINGALFWGTIMALFSIVPVLGAFVVWVPAAIVLVIQGSWVKAIILTVWGALVVGLVDNFLYPLLVGDRLRIHSLLVFFSALGGIMVFGASGFVLGPVVLAVSIGLLQLWQRRVSGSVSEAQLSEAQY